MINPGFKPLPFLSSPHLQMIVGSRWNGSSLKSEELLVDIDDGDYLSCQVSTPPKWVVGMPIVCLLHGLGGSHISPYMIRLSKRFYAANINTVRINLRGCGSGVGLSKRPYHSGNSSDVKKVLQVLKSHFPSSSITLIGFSLGGNLVLKLGGELNEDFNLIHHLIAVCPVLNLLDTVRRIEKSARGLYHLYYLNSILAQNRSRINKKTIHSIYQFDQEVTAPEWGYRSAEDYYEQCSSFQFISKIQIPCDILLAADDPFIDYKLLSNEHFAANIRTWLTEKGSHMGFLGRPSKKYGMFWLDQFLMERIGEHDASHSLL